jgi:hypothetical protein
VAADKLVVPREFKKYLTPSLQLTVELFSFLRWFSIGFAIFILFGPIFGPHIDHNGWRYLFGPLICVPLAGLCIYLYRPNPYRGLAPQTLGELDSSAPCPAQLLSIFGSEAAGKAILRYTAKITLIEFVAMAILLAVSAIIGKVTWSASSYWLWVGICGCFFSSFLALTFEVVAWGLRTWFKSAAT